MKKSFALLLAFAMVFSAFAPMALAADDKELSIEEKYEALAEAGIFAGINADGDAALDDDMTRAQAARILALIFDLDMENVPANATFSDVNAGHWAFDAVEAAVDAGLINGRGDGTFDPSGLVTHQEWAVMLALGYQEILGFEIDADGTVDGEVKPWAEQYVAFAVDNGILPVRSDYTTNANRGALAFGAYQGYVDASVPETVGIASAEASNFNEVTVELTKGLTEDQQEDAKFAVKIGAVTEDIEEVEFSKDGKTAVITLDANFRNGTYTVTLSGVADLDEDNATAEFTATEERVAEIQFTTPSDTLPQAKNVTIDFEAINQYGQKANVRANDFRIYVSDRDVEGSVTQSSDEQSFTIDTYIPDPRDNDARRPENLLQRGQGLYIRILHETSGVAADKTFTIGDRPIISKVEFGNLINEDGEEINYVRAGKTAFLEVAAYDQYGVRINSADVLNGLEDGVNEVSVFTSDRDLEVGDGTENGDRTPFVDGDGDGNVDLQLTAKDKLTGNFTVTAYSYGGSVSKVVEVKALRIPVRVEIPSYDKILADGDTDKYIPFKAFDVNGDELTAAEIVENADEFDIRTTGGLYLARNEIKRDGNDRGKIHIEEVDGRGQARIMVSIDRKYETEKTLNININNKREAVKLEWKTNPPASAIVGADDKLRILIKDQYGENYKDEEPGDRDYDFYVKVGLENTQSASDSKLVANDVDILPGQELIIDNIADIHDKDMRFYAGSQTGNYKINISLHLTDTDKEIYKLASKTVKVIDGRDSDDKLSYKVVLDKFNEEGTIMAVADVAGSVYSQDAKLATVPRVLKEVKVEATDGNDNKVAIKQEITNITSSRNSVAKGVEVDGKWYVAGVEEGTAFVTVHFNTQNGSDVAVVEVKTVDSNSKVQSIAFSKTNKVVAASKLDGAYVWAADLAEKLTVKDQFNNEFVSEKAAKSETNDYAGFLNLTYSIKVTNWGDAKTGDVRINSTTGQLDVRNIGSIEEFEITATAPNGESATFTVYVE